MMYQTKTRLSVYGIFALTILLLCCATISHAQDIILFDQGDVNSFYPGSVYNGNITIGKSTGGGSPVEITSLFNLSVLQELNGTLTISVNEDLENLDDLSNLTTINGNLIIASNDNLRNLDGLVNLESATQILSIHNNAMLGDISGLDNLTSLIGSLNIFNNNSLSQINHFSNLSKVRQISIGGNINLIQINGFESLDSLYSLNIANNDLLEEIKGFSNLLTTNDFLSIERNDELVDISGFSKLTNTGFFIIIENDGLENLDVFENLKKINYDLLIHSNDVLADCCGIHHLLSDPLAIDGPVTIFDNPAGCSSTTEILDQYCGLNFNYHLNPPCVFQDNGSIQINVTSYDVIPFSYQWERLEDGQMGSGLSNSNYFGIDMLGTGTYNITLTSPRPDTAYAFDIFMPEIDGSVFEVIQVESTNSTNGLSNGSIQIVVSGGLLPYDVSWSGTQNGSQMDVMSDTITIAFLAAGEYNILISDNNSIQNNVTLTLLDETVPTFPCTEPLDIVILNDVSGSVDEIEYIESQEFFVDFLEEVNIGLNSDESRAAIIEWSSEDQQAIKIPMIGDINVLHGYENESRSFEEGTVIHSAMEFGEEYLENIARPEAEKVLIIATDGSRDQVPGSLTFLADQLKAKGYHILTIAFDEAFSDVITRKVLFQMASIGALAPGAPAYSQLNEGLAENIVNTYLCPIDPGETSNVYFNRDGAITIDTLTPIASCVEPEYVEITFTIEAFRQLSIPGGTFVTFYLNNPEQSGATKLLSWQIPCSIPVDSSETYKVMVPINGPSHIFAVLNDNGESGIPISFPITNIDELAYSNNIDDDWICVGSNPTLQATKFTSTPTPSCDSIVNYTINVCNISESDASGVIVTDVPPDDFVLISSYDNLNGCASQQNSSYNISAGCCISIYLSYDASFAAWGYYGDQDVLLDGPPDQEYFGYNGESSSAEDVLLDGTIDCPSTIVEFTKEVDKTMSCDDAFVTFTFTINNELNFPIYGLEFIDIVPLPSQWVFEPYNLSGLTIGTKFINQNIAQFIIDEVEANTVASFSFDLSLGFWDADGILLNTAELDNVPDFENGGTKTLTSNSTSTQVSSSNPLSLPDTISAFVFSDTIQVDLFFGNISTINWTSNGDGSIIDDQSALMLYILGIQDKEDGQVSFTFEYSTECYAATDSVVVLLESCSLSLDEFEFRPCDDNGTNDDPNDDTFDIQFNVSADNPIFGLSYYIVVDNDTIGLAPYSFDNFVTVAADGLDHIITFVDQNYEGCYITDTVNLENCSERCNLDLIQLFITDCDDSDTPDDTSDDFFAINFVLGADYPGMDSTYFLIIGNDTLDGYSYYDEHQITLAASNNISDVQFVDSQYDDCILAINVGIENCIYPCELSLDEFTISECDDGDTSDDVSDDTFTISFNLSATYQGTDSTYLVIVDSDTIGAFPYDSDQIITLPADGIDHLIEFVDSEFQDCILSEIVNVNSCSGPCVIIVDLFDVSECDDNATPFDVTDDYFSITFNILADNPGTDNTYLVVIENDTIGEYPYISLDSIILPAGDSTYSVTFVDSQNEECSQTHTAEVTRCSNDCEIFLEQFTTSNCDDNNTPTEDEDDFYTLTFEVAATNPFIQSSYYVIINNDTIGEYAYDVEEVFTFDADGMELNITFVDSQNSDCLITESIQVNSCSTQCQLSFEKLSVSDCDDGGTGDDSSDDTFELTFVISGQNVSLDSTFVLVIGQDTIGIFEYFEDNIITIPTYPFDYQIFISDTENVECIVSETIRVESCSNICELSVDEFEISICDNMGTLDDGSDDGYSLSFNVSASYPYSDSTYDVFLDEQLLGTFTYGIDYSIDLMATGNLHTITFVDSRFDYCFYAENVDLDFCFVEEIIPDDIVIPNIFSPNKDDINDEWTVQLFNGSQIIACDIYDRWGNLIYKSLPGEIPEWDGYFNDKLLNPGVYIYKIVYNDSNIEPQVKYGDITILY